LLVGDLLQLNKLGSQATIHGRVKNLSALGYIKLLIDKEDGRRKFVTPTKMAFKYSEFMSKCLEDALKT
jgi:DNA-binding MarR family transcriptional regulator